MLMKSTHQNLTLTLLNLLAFATAGFLLFGKYLVLPVRQAAVAVAGHLRVVLLTALAIASTGLLWNARTFIRHFLQKLRVSYATPEDAVSRPGRGILQLMVLGCMLLLTGNLQAQSGTAFRDFNGDGLQTGAEPGVQGVLVRLFINTALPATDLMIGTAETDASGNFNFAVVLTSGRAANAGELVRIEFDIPNSFECSLAEDVDFEGLAGGVFGAPVCSSSPDNKVASGLPSTIPVSLCKILTRKYTFLVMLSATRTRPATTWRTIRPLSISIIWTMASPHRIPMVSRAYQTPSRWLPLVK